MSLSLADLAGGAIDEEFEIQLHRILRNIVDPNTVPGTAHKLNISLDFSPTLERDRVKVRVKFSGSVLPGIRPIETSLDIYPSGSVPEAIEVFTPRQTNLFEVAQNA